MNRLQQVEAENKSLKLQLEAANLKIAEIGELEANNSKLVGEVSAQQNIIQKLQTQINEMGGSEGRLNILETEVSTLKGENNNLQNNLNNLNQQLQSLGNVANEL